MRSNLDIAKIIIMILGGYCLLFSITLIFIYFLGYIDKTQTIFSVLFGILLGLWCIGFGASVPLKRFVQEENEKKDEKGVKKI